MEGVGAVTGGRNGGVEGEGGSDGSRGWRQGTWAGVGGRERGRGLHAVTGGRNGGREGEGEAPVCLLFCHGMPMPNCQLWNCLLSHLCYAMPMPNCQLWNCLLSHLCYAMLMPNCQLWNCLLSHLCYAMLLPMPPVRCCAS